MKIRPPFFVSRYQLLLLPSNIFITSFYIITINNINNSNGNSYQGALSPFHNYLHAVNIFITSLNTTTNIKL